MAPRHRLRPPLAVLAVSTLLSCADGRRDEAFSDATTTAASGDTGAVGPGTSHGTDPKYDVGAGTGGGPGDGGGGPSCSVENGDIDGVAPGTCEGKAPADAFAPTVEWSWMGPEDARTSIVTPLVANLTDDDGDGDIDLCDTPDVVVVTAPCSGLDLNAGCDLSGHIYVLDGGTGSVHFRIDQPVHKWIVPAIGDIDGDGLSEIVTAVGGSAYVTVFEHDGTEKWSATSVPWVNDQGGAIALADLDADGDVEIVADTHVFDHEGNHLWAAPEQEGFDLLWRITATAVADLDEDGTQEIVLGQSAYRYDGSVYYQRPDIGPGFPQIANLDDDPQPEILVTNRDGITILEHDGTVKVKDLRPTGDPVDAWFRPATVHDFDGDLVSEFAVSSAGNYSVYEPDGSLKWSAEVVDVSGWAAGTAFDFIGDGSAEAMYADEWNLFAFDASGTPVIEWERSGKTLIDYPVVADVDNDASAEIVVVSGESYGIAMQTAPTVQVLGDAEDRWVPARRIWNQHTYHVTNVREDGTIPAQEKPSWRYLNTYRTQAQIEEGGVCKPKPEG